MLEHTKHASGELRVPAPKDREQRQIRRREWLHQRKNLRMEGQMLRFKLAPSRQGGSAGPSQKATEDVSDKQPENEDEKETLHRQLVHVSDLPPLWSVVSITSGHIGGLRDDPFASFPIENKGCVQGAFDFYAQVYVPIGVRRIFRDTNETDQNLLSTYFPALLHDPAYFHLIIAMSMLLQQYRKYSSARMTPEIRYHANEGLSLLRQGLKAGPQGISNTLILSIITLLGFHIVTGDWSTWQSHLAGLRTAVRLRGGTDQLGWGGFLKLRVEGMETFNAEVVETNGLVDNKDQPSRSQTPRQKEYIIRQRVPTTWLNYPEHPFPAELLQKISKLPKGFEVPALARELSTQTVDILYNIQNWLDRNPRAIQASTQDQHDSVPTLPSVDTIESRVSQALASRDGHSIEPRDTSEFISIKRPEDAVGRSTLAAYLGVRHCPLRPTEKCLAIALILYTVSLDLDQPLHPFADSYLVALFRELEKTEGPSQFRRVDTACLLWTAWVMANVTGAELGSELHYWSRSLLRDRNVGEDGEEVKKIEARFWPVRRRRARMTSSSC